MQATTPEVADDIDWVQLALQLLNDYDPTVPFLMDAILRLRVDFAVSVKDFFASYPGGTSVTVDDVKALRAWVAVWKQSRSIMTGVKNADEPATATCEADRGLAFVLAALCRACASQDVTLLIESWVLPRCINPSMAFLAELVNQSLALPKGIGELADMSNSGLSAEDARHRRKVTRARLLLSFRRR